MTKPGRFCCNIVTWCFNLFFGWNNSGLQQTWYFDFKVNDLVLQCKWNAKEWIMMGWEAIDRLGKNKLLSTSYIWLIIVPIFAKFFEKVNEILDFSKYVPGLKIVLDLPFQWEIFYVSAIMIAVANAIYTLRCPDIIQQFSSYADFEQQRKGLPFVKAYALKRGYRLLFDKFQNLDSIAQKDKTRELKEQYSPENSGKVITLVLDTEKAENVSVTGKPKKEPEFYEELLANHHQQYLSSLPTAYMLLRHHENYAYKYFRYACTTLYVGGLLLLVSVMVNNACYVFMCA